MEPRTLYGLALALLTVVCVLAALIYANRETWAQRRGHRRYEKDRRAKNAARVAKALQER